MKRFIKFIIYSLILSIIINILCYKFINKDNISILGYSCLKVVSGSMEPEIKAGENIIIKKCSKYDVGDIITYMEENNNLITHRIVSIHDDLYYTKGDANNVQDFNPVTLSQIYGKVIFHFKSFFHSSVFSYSKYINSNKISVNVQIANPIFIVKGDTEIIIKNYGVTNSYNFSVRNYNETSTSDIDFNYNIQIVADKDVKTTLFCNDIIVDTNNTFLISHNAPMEHKYLLKIEAPEDYEGKVKINVYAYQTKEG